MREYKENYYYINLPSGKFGITYPNKEKAIKVFLDVIEKEKGLSDYWTQHALKYEKMIEDGQVEIITIERTIKEEIKREVLNKGVNYGNE